MTYRAVVNFGKYGSWSQGGYATPSTAIRAAWKYVKEHPEVHGRCSATYEPENEVSK